MLWKNVKNCGKKGELSRNVFFKKAVFDKTFLQTATIFHIFVKNCFCTFGAPKEGFSSGY